MFDFIIKNGLIVDGSRNKPFLGNLYAKDGKIVKIAKATDDTDVDLMHASQVYDAAGHVVAPGFINLHSHSDNTYIVAPTYESMLDGGVTFELCGQCGLSCIPLRKAEQCSPGNGLLKLNSEQLSNLPKNITEYAKKLQETGISINIGMMIGHGALRTAVIGMDQRPLTANETIEMCELLDAELKAGALGVSFGLIYAPGSFCDTEEIKALARVCSANKKVLAVHMRNENLRVFEALDEMIEVALETGVHLEISHLKLMGKAMWGRAFALLAKIDEARNRGVTIYCDQYPYDASHSGLYSCLPNEAKSGGLINMAVNIKDDAFWDRVSDHGLLPEMELRGGAENIIIDDVGNANCPEVIGRSLPEIAKMYGTTVPDVVRQLLIRCNGRVQCVYHNMSMDDVLMIMSRRDISVVSDGTAYNLSNFAGRPHPRNCGTFPRFFRLVREHQLMPIEDAVYKVTYLPSSIMGTDDQFGLLKEGLDATITVFDQETITDHATYDNPNLKNEGIDYVFVNGQKVLDHGIITGLRPGKCILR